MYRLVVAPMLLSVAACAMSPLEPPAANSFADSEVTLGSAAPAVASETIDIEELDNGLVCEYEKRPGSHIAQEYCYTREEQAANQEAQDALVRRQMQTLSMEQEARATRDRDLARSRGGVLTY